MSKKINTNVSSNNTGFPPFKYKVLVVGDSSVGKSTLIKYFSLKKIDHFPDTTLNVEMKTVVHIYNKI